MKKRAKIYWGAFILDWFKELNDLDFSRGDYRVLFFVCSQINPQDNIAYLKQKKISSELSMDPGNVSKCIKNLIDYQFIVKVENGFMVNPHLFYIGKAQYQDRKFLREDFDLLLKNDAIYFLDEFEGELQKKPPQKESRKDDFDNGDYPF